MKKFLLTLTIFFIIFSAFAQNPNSISVGQLTPESEVATARVSVSASVPDKVFIKVGGIRIDIKDKNYFEGFLSNFQKYVSIVVQNDTTVVVRKQLGFHRSRNFITSIFIFRTNGTGGEDSCYLIWKVSDMAHNGGAIGREVIILNNEEVETLISFFTEAKSELKRMNEEIEKFGSKTN